MTSTMTRTSSVIEMEVINESSRASTSAPPPQTLDKQHKDQQNQDRCDEIHGKALQRRSTGSRKLSRKKTKRMGSSSSLHSLVSILKPPDCDQHQQRSASNVSFGHENSYNENDMKFSGGDDGEINNRNDIEIDENFIQNVNGRGSLSTTHSTIGFRASFFSLLEKLGVYRSQEIYKQPTVAEIKTSTDRRTNRNSITSLYFRTIYGGK
jgi:hypothetical protein